MIILGNSLHIITAFPTFDLLGLRAGNFENDF